MNWASLEQVRIGLAESFVTRITSALATARAELRSHDSKGWGDRDTPSYMSGYNSLVDFLRSKVMPYVKNMEQERDEAVAARDRAEKVFRDSLQGAVAGVDEAVVARKTVEYKFGELTKKLTTEFSALAEEAKAKSKKAAAEYSLWSDYRYLASQERQCVGNNAKLLWKKLLYLVENKARLDAAWCANAMKELEEEFPEHITSELQTACRAEVAIAKDVVVVVVQNAAPAESPHKAVIDAAIGEVRKLTRVTSEPTKAKLRSVFKSLAGVPSKMVREVKYVAIAHYAMKMGRPPAVAKDVVNRILTGLRF